MLKQNLQLKLSQKLSPQQIQLMKLIQLPTLAFENRIKQEIEENPALETGKEAAEQDEYGSSDEFDQDNQVIDTSDIDIDSYLSDDEIPNYRLSSNNYANSDEDKHIPYAAGISFHQQLLQQLNTFTLEDKYWDIAEYLIGSIDETGYIRREIDDIIDDLAFTRNIFAENEDIQNVLDLIQTFDPAGIGARNLEECLLLQLKRKEQTTEIAHAITLIEEHFEQFTKKHYQKIIARLKISEEELKDVIAEIERLNPKPGSSFGSSSKVVEQIIPDFSIRIIDGDLQLQLNNRNIPDLHVSRNYSEMLQSFKESKSNDKKQRDTVLFIKQKLDAAKWFIDAIKQRYQTLFVTMNAIMHYQEEYFLSGDESDLRPMILRDIAEEIGMDVSTVSRVANSKYVDTPYGTKLIKAFFSESMTNESGEEISTKEIKSILSEVISNESKKKPLTDEVLASKLKEKGYPIARRTVAKYREQLGYPVARLRKKL